MWKHYHSVISIDEALEILAKQGARARIVAGATDLLLEMERGVRKGIDTLIDISRVPDLDEIEIDQDEVIHLGPMVTHNHCVASKLIVERAFPLARAAWEVGAPQIRNCGTVAGNLITASPANDTIAPLMALNAMVRLVSQKGERLIPLSKFYTGVRSTVMQPEEMLVDIAFKAMSYPQRGTFMKLGLRRAQAISLVNAAIVITFEETNSPSKSIEKGAPGSKIKLPVKNVAITLGAVAPTIIHAQEAEKYLEGRVLSDETIAHAADLAMKAAQPISDIRSSAAYRSEIVRVCVSRGLHGIWKSQEKEGFPSNPVLLWGRTEARKGEQPETGGLFTKSIHHIQGTPISTTINGKRYSFPTGHHKTLLRLIREDAGLTGTKEGCAEGECGACTIFLDGKAVMSCLVPAARADGAVIVTIEGLAKNGKLHPLQQSFIDQAAVQCGYCTPGFIMSAVKLLEEQSKPDREAIKHAITGNLCRCTGYYKIVEAIERVGFPHAERITTDRELEEPYGEIS